MFKIHYSSQYCWVIPTNNPLENYNTVKNVIAEYKNHPSIINIKNRTNLNVNTSDFPDVTAEERNKIIEDINPAKATSPNNIPLKMIKLPANSIDSQFTNIVIKDINNNLFSENTKIVSVRQKEKEKVGNRAVSIVNCFSKIYKRYTSLKKSNSFKKGFLSQFIICIQTKLQLMSCLDKVNCKLKRIIRLSPSLRALFTVYHMTYKSQNYIHMVSV